VWSARESTPSSIAPWYSGPAQSPRAFLPAQPENPMLFQSPAYQIVTKRVGNIQLRAGIDRDCKWEMMKFDGRLAHFSL